MVIWGWRYRSGGGDVALGDAALGGRDGDLGGGDTALGGGDAAIVGGDGDLEGGDGVVGDGDVGVEIFAYFSKEGELVEKVVEESVLQGNPHIVLCLCFSVDLANDK